MMNNILSDVKNIQFECLINILRSKDLYKSYLNFINADISYVLQQMNKLHCNTHNKIGIYQYIKRAEFDIQNDAINAADNDIFNICY